MSRLVTHLTNHRKIYFALLASLTLHLLLVGLFKSTNLATHHSDAQPVRLQLTTVAPTLPPLNMSKQQNFTPIPSTIQHSKNLPTQEKIQQAHGNIQNKPKTTVVKKQSVDISDVITHDSPMASPLLSAAPKEQTLDHAEYQKLLLALHHAIDYHKQYPTRLKRLRRKDHVRIAFTLKPNGFIENMVTKKPSRYHAFDQAAKAAVQKISPFALAKQVLKSPTQFEVIIRFQ